MRFFSFPAFHRCKCLSAAFRKGRDAGGQLQQSFTRPQPETAQWGGTGWHLVCTSRAGSSVTTQLVGGSEKPNLFSEGQLHRRLKLCCCERGGVVMSLVALSFPKPLRRYGASSRVRHTLSMGKAPSFNCA